MKLCALVFELKHSQVVCGGRGAMRPKPIYPQTQSGDIIIYRFNMIENVKSILWVTEFVLIGWVLYEFHGSLGLLPRLFKSNNGTHLTVNITCILFGKVKKLTKKSVKNLSHFFIIFHSFFRFVEIQGDIQVLVYLFLEF